MNLRIKLCVNQCFVKITSYGWRRGRLCHWVMHAVDHLWVGHRELPMGGAINYISACVLGMPLGGVDPLGVDQITPWALIWLLVNGKDHHIYK